ncbi:MAG: murein biosynthesis integral membrane protein MurJ [Armatimonadaceae bacterium]
MTIGFVLLSRVLGVVRSMVIARIFGQNEITDIYNRAFAVPDMLYLMMAGGALSTVFIPVFTGYLQNNKDEEAWKTFGRVITLVAVAVAAVILLAELLAYPLCRLAAPKFSEQAVADMVPLTRILLPAQFFFFVGGLIIATLQARERWLIPNAAPVIYNAGIIGGAILLGTKVGPIAMTWGAVAGAAVGNFLLPLWDLSRSGVRWRLAFDWKHPGVRQFGILLLPAMLGLGLSQLGFLITGFFVDAEGGEFTALKNGNELTQAPIGIFAQASALVLFPTITRLAAAGDFSGMRDELDGGLRRILFLTIPASLLMAVLAEPIITLLYAGSRFGATEVANAALALRLYSIGTFAWSAQAVVGRGFFAMQDTKTPLTVTKYMLALFTLLCFVSIQMLHLPFGALAFSSSLVGTINVLWLLLLLRERLPGLSLRGIAIATGRIAAIAGLASALTWGISRAFPLSLPDVAPLIQLDQRLTRARQGLVLAERTGANSAEADTLRQEVATLQREYEEIGAPMAKRFAGEIAPVKWRSLLAVLLAGGLGVLAYGALAWMLRIPELWTVRALFRRSGKSSPTPPVTE